MGREDGEDERTSTHSSRVRMSSQPDANGTEETTKETEYQSSVWDSDKLIHLLSSDLFKVKS